MNTALAALRTEGVSTRDACALIGRSRATHYRRLQPPVHGPVPARAAPDNGQALSAAEREAVLVLIKTEANAELSIGQIWARELDEGHYLCSAPLAALVPVLRVARTAPLGSGTQPSAARRVSL